MPTETAAAYIASKRSCCVTTSCADQGCTLILPVGQGDLACINGSRYQAHHKMSEKLCDCAIFWSFRGRDTFVPAELKGGRVRAAHCLDQLQNGAKLAQSLLGSYFQLLKFIPLIVHKGGIHPTEYKILQYRRISFRKVRRHAKLVKSGTHLGAQVA